MSDKNNETFRRVAIAEVHRMTASEAFMESLVSNDVTDAFGITGSANSDALDPLGAGHVAAGYSKLVAVCFAQNSLGLIEGRAQNAK